MIRTSSTHVFFQPRISWNVSQFSYNFIKKFLEREGERERDKQEFGELQVKEREKESESKRERLRNGKEKENKRGSVKTKREGMQWKEGKEEMGGRKGRRGQIGQNEGEINE